MSCISFLVLVFRVLLQALIHTMYFCTGQKGMHTVIIRRTHTHARTHAHKHAHTHTHTYILFDFLSYRLSDLANTGIITFENTAGKC